MRQKKNIILLLLLSIILISTTSRDKKPEKANAAETLISVQILGINDFHGQLDVYRTSKNRRVGGAEYLAAYLKKHKLENPNTLLVHAGDVVGASAAVSSLHQDEPTIEFLNTLEFDVGTVGNHEFDEGHDELKRLLFGGKHESTGHFTGADFPHTVANVIDKQTGESILPPYVIKQIEGIPIGFIGVVTTDTTRFVLPDGIEGLEFIDEVTAINTAAEELTVQGVKAIVVLAHNSASTNPDGSEPSGDVAEFANLVDDEVDIIFGAHNHAYANALVDNKLIVQAYSSGIAFSKVDLWLDPVSKDIVKKKAEVVMTFHDGTEPDHEIKSMVESYRQPVASVINQVIGKTHQMVTRKQNESGESALGNVIADSERQAMETDIAFVNPGGVRAHLDRGDITWGEVYTAFPFGHQLVKMNLTGTQIKAALEQQWIGDEIRMLQIAGLQYSWNSEAPIGQRIVEMKDEDGNPINDHQVYTVTVNEILADGGDGFTVFTEGSDIVMGPNELDTFIQYLQSFEESIIVPELNRITKN